MELGLEFKLGLELVLDLKFYLELGLELKLALDLGLELKLGMELLLLLIWQSPGLPGWRKVNLITVTRRPHHPNIAAGLYCLATSPGFLPTLCEKWSGFF